MAVDSFVAVPDASKFIATEERVQGATTVEYQQVVLIAGEMPHGCLVYHVISGASANAANIKALAGNVYGWRIFNNAGYPIYLKLHNTAGVPTPGAGVVETIGVQAGSSSEIFPPLGSAYATGIGITIVKGIADSDATPVAANDCSVDLFFK